MALTHTISHSLFFFQDNNTAKARSPTDTSPPPMAEATDTSENPEDKASGKQLTRKASMSIFAKYGTVKVSDE